MYTVVTGAAGFIGSNIVKALNARGETNILAVDNLKRSEKCANLADCVIADYLDKEEFLSLLADDSFEGELDVVLHQGACSDTMEGDGRYMMENNYRYSVSVLNYCQLNEVPFVYASSASVYGTGRMFRESPEHERPLNAYGYSKLAFDQYVRFHQGRFNAPVVGLRYFNVYGPREAHKARMASVIFHFVNQYRRDGRIRLFEGWDGYADGQQRRDFVSIDDVVKINLHFMQQRPQFALVNVGTGSARTFNDVALATINACRAQQNQPPAVLQALTASGAIDYINFPRELVGKYQSFTQADLTQLRAAGYQAPLLPIEEGIPSYVRWLLAQNTAAAS